MKAAHSSLLPVCLLKLFFHSTNALGEVCVTQRQLSLSFSPPNYATFNQTAQKQTVKRIKSEMEIHSPFTRHSPQTVEVLDFGSRILCRRFCEQLLHFSIHNPHLSIRSNNLLRLDETLMIPVWKMGRCTIARKKKSSVTEHTEAYTRKRAY